ncbi:uncharacterized protein [Cardiocondyla obscurior]|uniref:uncharacterized protein n=1 Tax=Cardiocondyla obscurior TaxID=286306 RepID=UPI00396583F3
MPKDFKHLSLRQKYRRIKTIEKYDQDMITYRTKIPVTNAEAPICQLPNVNTNVSTEQNFVFHKLTECNNCICLTDASNVANCATESENRATESKNIEQSKDKVCRSSELCHWLNLWKVRHNITHAALSDLLSKLRTCCYPDLQKDSRTLLNTPRHSIIQVVGENGSFFHYGLEKAILEQLDCTNFKFQQEIIMIDINIDGLPISKSSKSQIWPILGKIYGEKIFTPFIISAYHGYVKPPNVQNFLTPFCEEYNKLQNTGLFFNEKRHSVQIRSVICDSPARAFVTCTKSHNGFFGCGKCMQEGTYSNHHMLFLESTALLRTDQNFKNRTQEDHHTGVSPFESIIQLPMVTRFPLDYMHLICLGVVKKMLQLWVNGYYTSKLNARKVAQLSEMLIKVSKWVPKEFTRKPRALDELTRWKATEFQEFLLYLGPVLLINILPPDYLQHFNALHCAVRILCHPTDCFRNNRYSKDLILQFIQLFRHLYGIETIIYNVHNLIHINEDVLQFGALDSFSAFPFENYMQSIKKMLMKPDKPLQQLYRRISENCHKNIEYGSINKSNFFILKNKYFGVLPMKCTNAHRTIQFREFYLTTKKPNNCCYLKNKTIVVIVHICFNEENIPVVIGKKFLTQHSLPYYPCDSRNMNIYVVENLSHLLMWPITEIANKAVQLPFEEQTSWCCFPLLHSS